MVVAEYRYSNSVVRIHDDHMAKTDEENARIVSRITEMVSKYRQLEACKRETA
jgi:hypothetical protein